MNKKIIISLLIGFSVAGAASFFLNTQHNRELPLRKRQVVASFYPLYFFAQQIGGDKADTINITPAGAEPHDYEPTPKDIAHIEDSTLLILNGGGLEAWGDTLRQNLGGKKTIIITVGEGLTNQYIMGKGREATDPHIWLSPLVTKQIVDTIAQGFVQVDPANKDYYQSNANRLQSKLDDLDQKFRQGLADCQDKNIITSHAAFGYLATIYGLNQVPIAGLSPDAEPSPQQLATIVTFAKTRKVKYIFFERLVSPKLSATIATEVGAKTLVLNPIEGLSDEEIAQGKNYFTEMETNLTHLRTALQCRP